MNACSGNDLIKEKTGRKLETTFFQSRYRLRSRTFLLGGLVRQLTL